MRGLQCSVAPLRNLSVVGASLSESGAWEGSFASVCLLFATCLTYRRRHFDSNQTFLCIYICICFLCMVFQSSVTFAAVAMLGLGIGDIVVSFLLYCTRLDDSVLIGCRVQATSLGY